jgi:hypothetical protein
MRTIVPHLPTPVTSPRRESVWTYAALTTAPTRVLYVGVTNNPARRMLEHTVKPWWPEVHRVGWFEWPDRRAALAAEAVFIGHFRPLYNVAYDAWRESEATEWLSEVVVLREVA